jgi:Spy/CpxP family protein refolding chaperone
VEALMLEGATDEAEAEQLIVRMRRVRTEEARLFAQEQEELLEFLTAVQVLKLQSIRDDMGRRIQRLRGRDGSGPRSPRGNGYI